MTDMNREELVVARRPGTRLFIAGTSGSRPSLAGLSERTIFFNPDTAEQELRRMGVPYETIELRPATLSARIG